MINRKVTAFLGPTNTGKTYHAMEKLFSYSNGVIGFPLRLLARENFEIAKKKVNKNEVALITGEEKIIPEKAKYFFCTVESIPMDKEFDFVAIDEIQLAADFERGHLFTEKILNKQGKKETIFLGSRSIENVLKKIFPEIKIIHRQRLSKLSYSGYKNLSRLPKRSAIIAFSQIDLYEIAEKIKQFYGGVSVVMGALSPDVRNSQVKLFEDGKVDYMVATDAIGLGLNLNIKNIFFTNLLKFDGKKRRYLSYDEIAQISGRAGRFTDDGFFGTTYKLKSLNNNLIKFIEDLEHTEIKKIYWRNTKINFQSPSRLIKSLNQNPKNKIFLQKKDAKDFNCLKIILNDKKVCQKINKEKNLMLLWEVCSIPDFTNILDDFHSRFLIKIFQFLVENKKINEPWIEEQLTKIKKKSPRIGDLNLKIAQIRIWSFISYKNNWLNKPIIYQKKIRKIEYDLSKYLHESLINQFVSDYNYFKSKKNILNTNSQNLISLDNKKIKFGNSIIGEIKGFSFSINPIFKNKKNFNFKILKKRLEFFSNDLVSDFESSSYSHFSFDILGNIFWKDQIVGKFYKGEDVFNPRIKIFFDSFFLSYKKKIEQRIFDYLNFVLQKTLPFYKFIDNFDEHPTKLRAILFFLKEGLGQCKKKEINNFYNSLKSDQAKWLKKIGIKNGVNFFFFKKCKFNLFNQMIINIYYLLNLSNFITNEITKINDFKKIKNQLLNFQKMGFYLVKIEQGGRYLVHFSYLERVLCKAYSLRKNKKNKQLKNIIRNDFERIAFTNVNKINLCHVTDFN